MRVAIPISGYTGFGSIVPNPNELGYSQLFLKIDFKKYDPGILSL
jgi:hypothetical protein